MNERILLIHVYTDPSLHSIMVESFAVVDVAVVDVDVRVGDSFGKNLGPLTAAKSRSFRKIFPQTLGGRQRNLKSRGKLSGTIYVTGPIQPGLIIFREWIFIKYASLNVAVCVVVCVKDTLQHKNNGQLRLVMST